MMKQVLTVLGCGAAIALAQAARADGTTVTPITVTGDLVQIFDDVVTDGGLFYDNSRTGNPPSYFSPPDGAVPVEIGTAVVYSGSYHVNNFTFAYATNVPDNGIGPIEVIINFYGSLGSDDGPDTVSGPIASIDIPGLPGATSTGNAYIVGPHDLTGPGLDFDFPSSTFAFDGTTTGNWVTFTFQQTGTGPIVASGATILSAFWTGKDLNAPYEAGSFFWNFGREPPAFFLQLGGVSN